MLAEFIDKIRGFVEVETFNLEGRPYTSRKVFPVEDPKAPAMRLSTLQGFVGFVKANVDQLDSKSLMIHVGGHDRVRLVSKLSKDWKERDTYIEATMDNHGDGFSFGRQYDVESFIIALQADFAPTEDIASMLRVVGSMSTERVMTAADDGITQTVSSKSGIALKERVELPNPVKLKPYRTFVEVEQPLGSFVFRVKQGRDGEMPTCALFDADGGQWKLAAINSIRDYLAKEITEIPIIT